MLNELSFGRKLSCLKTRVAPVEPVIRDFKPEDELECKNDYEPFIYFMNEETTGLKAKVTWWESSIRQVHQFIMRWDEIFSN